MTFPPGRKLPQQVPPHLVGVDRRPTLGDEELAGDVDPRLYVPVGANPLATLAGPTEEARSQPATEPASPTANPDKPSTAGTAEPSIEEQLSKAVLNLISSATREALAGYALCVAVVVYVLLGQIGLVLLGVGGGVMLHASWERAGSNDIGDLAVKRRRRAGPDDTAPTHRRLGAAKLTSLGPLTAKATQRLIDAIVNTHIKSWYHRLAEDEADFPAACRKEITQVVAAAGIRFSEMDSVSVLSHVAIRTGLDLKDAFEAIKEITQDHDFGGSISDVVEAYADHDPDSKISQLINRKSQQHKLDQVSSNIVKKFGTSALIHYEPAERLITHILSRVVLEAVVSKMASEQTINEAIINHWTIPEAVAEQVAHQSTGIPVGPASTLPDADLAAGFVDTRAARQLGPGPSALPGPNPTAPSWPHNVPAANAPLQSGLRQADGPPAHAGPAPRNEAPLQAGAAGAYSSFDQIIDHGPSGQGRHQVEEERKQHPFKNAAVTVLPPYRTSRSSANSNFSYDIQVAPAGQNHGWMLTRSRSEVLALASVLDAVSKINQLQLTLPDSVRDFPDRSADDLEVYLNRVVEDDRYLGIQKLYEFLAKPESEKPQVEPAFNLWTTPSVERFRLSFVGALGARLSGGPRDREIHLAGQNLSRVVQPGSLDRRSQGSGTTTPQPGRGPARQNSSSDMPADDKAGSSVVSPTGLMSVRAAPVPPPRQDVRAPEAGLYVSLPPLPSEVGDLDIPIGRSDLLSQSGQALPGWRQVMISDLPPPPSATPDPNAPGQPAPASRPELHISEEEAAKLRDLPPPPSLTDDAGRPFDHSEPAFPAQAFAQVDVELLDLPNANEMSMIKDSLYNALYAFFDLSPRFDVARQTTIKTLKAVSNVVGGDRVKMAWGAFQSIVLTPLQSDEQRARIVDRLCDASFPRPDASPTASPVKQLTVEQRKREALRLFSANAVPKGVAVIGGNLASQDASKRLWEALMVPQIARGIVVDLLLQYVLVATSDLSD